MPTVETTGVILKTLVDEYGILPPEIVQVPIPTPLENREQLGPATTRPQTQPPRRRSPAPS